MAEAQDIETQASLLAASSAASPLALPLLAMKGIVKRYGAVAALDQVDFEARAGEIHALLGENGAGKSTLMHVLAGMTRPDSGQIQLVGKPVRVTSARSARSLGIAMVHQHFTLVPAFTVAENLALDTAPSSFFTTLPRPYLPEKAAERALQRARSLGWPLEANAPVADLSVGAQQRVEIIKALATEARLLIFDEPTAVLSSEEVEDLFQVLRRLRDEGCAVILMAHKLAEILAVADRVTVLRRGRRVASVPVAETDAARLAAWMIGEAAISPPAALETQRHGGDREDGEDKKNAEALSSAETKHTNALTPQCLNTKQPVFSATDLVVLGDRGEEALRGLSLEVRPGEILGIGGVDGNGQMELAEALVGLRPLRSGAMTWEGGPLQPGRAPRTGYIPQDRRRAGLAVSMTIEDNLLWDAIHEPRYRIGPFVRRKALRQLSDSLIWEFDIRTPSGLLPASALSGGNQQKIVVARALRSEPEWIVAMNPTRGLDIGATRFVQEQLRKARKRGAAIVLITTDLDELGLLSDRAAILSGGKLTEYQAERSRSAELGLLLGGISRPVQPPANAAVSTQGGAEAEG